MVGGDSCGGVVGDAGLSCVKKAPHAGIGIWKLGFWYLGVGVAWLRCGKIQFLFILPN